MAALPYMQFYIADYLADTTHLSTEEHGAYLLLLFNYWQAGKALPDNNERLARIVRLSNERWISVRDTLAEFFQVVDGEWRHSRIDDDLFSVSLKIEQTSKAGKASAAARNAKAREARRQRAVNERSTGVGTNVQQNGNENSTNDNDTDIYKKIKTLSANADHVAEIFSHWVSVMGKTGAAKLTPKRRKCVQARLREGYTPDQIKIAIDNCRADPWSMGENDRHTPFNDLELICRSGEKLERFFTKPATTKKQEWYGT